MAVYGFEVKTTRGDGMTDVRRLEVEGFDAREARGHFTGWAAVTGVRVDSLDLIADGMTFREHVTRSMLNQGARMCQRVNGVSVEGPESWDEPWAERVKTVMRLLLPNGWGVSLSCSLSAQNWSDVEMVTWRGGVDFSAGVMEYESRIGGAGDGDDDVARVLEALAKI